MRFILLIRRLKMSEKESLGRSNPLGCLAPAVGIAGLVATLALGPIDL